MPRKKNKTNKKLKFENINPVLDEDHANIIATIDKLYDICKTHWNNEKKLYRNGKKMMPAYHQDVSDEWKNHDNEHKETLKQISQLRTNIINHINSFDVQHFHWMVDSHK